MDNSKHEEEIHPVDTDLTDENSNQALVRLPAEEEHGYFDVLGDFFRRMVVGIFIFIGVRIPKKIWEIIGKVELWEKLLKQLRSFLYWISWLLIWGALVFGVWLILKDYAGLQWLGWIWLVAALMGSAYGLLYVSLKHRAKKKGKEFKGLFGWLRRHKNDTLVSNEEKSNLKD